VSSLLRLRVITPSGVLLDVRDVAWVRMQLADGGGIGILPGHSPLLAESILGDIVYTYASAGADAGASAQALGEQAQSVGAGIMSIRDNEITVLTVDAAAAEKETPGEFGGGAGQPGPEASRFRRLAKALYAQLGADRGRNSSGQGQTGQEQD